MSVESAAQPERAQPERAQPERAQPEGAQPERAQPGWASGTARRALRLVAGHKIISAAVAVLVAAAIAVSLATTGPGKPKV
jgi:hypothetical protein